MTKAALKNFTTEIARKRREMSRLQGDLTGDARLSGCDR